MLRQLLAFGRFSHIFYVEVDSNPVVDCRAGLHLRSEWRSMLSRCFSSESSRTWILDITSTSLTQELLA